jgi:hypothetical protein
MERGTPPALKDPTPGLIWYFLVLPGIVAGVTDGLFLNVVGRGSPWRWVLTSIVAFSVLATLKVIKRRYPRVFDWLDNLAQRVTTGSLQAWSPTGLGVLFGFFEIFVLIVALQGGWRALLIGTAGSFLMAFYLWSIASWSDTFSKRHRKATFFDACLLLGTMTSGFLGIVYLMVQLSRL